MPACTSWHERALLTDRHLAVALTGVRVWDGVAAGLSSEPLNVRIEGDRIVAIGRDESLLRDAQSISPGEGSVALPGLIDAHVHMTLNPALRSVEAQLAVEPDRLVSEMEARAAAMLEAGITTARDLGGGAWLELELRDRIQRGEIPGPRLLCAGQPLTVPGGHCHFWGGVVKGPDEIRATIRRQVERGADWLKVMATGGVLTPGVSIRDVQFEAEELKVVRHEADLHGRAVAAHCHGTAGIRAAVEAGLRSVEHCSFAGSEGFGCDFDPVLADRIAAQETWVSPTVNAGWGRFIAKDGEQTRFFSGMRGCFRRLRAAGVKLIASTDAGIPGVEHQSFAAALGVFARYAELDAVDALRSASSESARALGLEAETGRLRPGLAADILVVGGNPLEDLSLLTRPLLVLARGQRVTRREPQSGAAEHAKADSDQL